MFTIIVATYNAANCLHNLLASIIVQKSISFELIIIDGGSKDGTVDTIKKFETDITYWVSEKDDGIFDAWNKGVVKANNHWIMFLGADDTLMPNALEKYQDYLCQEKSLVGLDFLSSRRKMVDINGKFIRVTGYRWEWPLFLKFMTVSHPGSLHSKALFEKYGLFDTTYKITGDYELLLRPKNKLKADFIDEITVSVSEGGASDSIAALKEHFRAVTLTGGSSKIFAFRNSVLMGVKLIVKRLFRKCGMNVYIQQ